MDSLTQLVLRLLAAAWIIATLLPLWRHDGWWVRAFDFPRVQIFFSGLALAAIYLGLGAAEGRLDLALWVALALCLAFHAYRILPFTRWVPVNVVSGEVGQPASRLSILVANVFMENRRADALLDLIRRWSPDVVLTVETDDWWAERLSGLEEEYPFTVQVPLDNTYGMLLHSRLELVEPQVKYLVDDDVPSIHADLALADGRRVRLHMVHPKPPYPAESTRTTERDGELLLVGREVARHDVPTIVAGDFNDVAWSYTTRLLRRISGLRDPRIGRGLFSTYHARYRLLRWPLDHVLCSRHFRLLRIERLPYCCSDHFPIFLEVSLEPDAAVEADGEPDPGTEEMEIAEEKIEAADPQADLG